MVCIVFGTEAFSSTGDSNLIPNMITLYLFISTATNAYGLISLASYLASRDASIFDGIV